MEIPAVLHEKTCGKFYNHTSGGQGFIPYRVKKSLKTKNRALKKGENMKKDTHKGNGTNCANPPKPPGKISESLEDILREYIDIETLYNREIYTLFQSMGYTSQASKLAEEIATRQGINKMVIVDKKLNNDQSKMNVRILTHSDEADFSHEMDDDYNPEEHPENAFNIIVPATEEELAKIAELEYNAYSLRRSWAIELRFYYRDLFARTAEETLKEIESLIKRIYSAVNIRDFLYYQKELLNAAESVDSIPDDRLNIIVNSLVPLKKDYIEGAEEPGNGIAAFACSMWLSDILPAGLKSLLYDLKYIATDPEHNPIGEAADALQNYIEKKSFEISHKWFPVPDSKEKEISTENKEPFNIKFGRSDTAQLAQQIFSIPENYTQDLTKTSLAIFGKNKLAEGNGQMQIDVSRKNSKEPVYVIVDATFNDISTTREITTFDESVLNAISSLLETGQIYFTSKQIAGIVFHGDIGTRSSVSKNQIGAVTKSIEKMRLIDLTINWTEHAKMNNKTDTVSHKTSGYLLPVDKDVSVKSGGQVIRTYALLNNPPLYTYSRAVGQVNTVPMKLLNIPNVRMDERIAMMRDYMFKQIGHMKNPHSKIQRIMTLDSIMKSAGIDLESEEIKSKKEIKSKNVNLIERILQYFRSEGYIKDYEITKKGRTLHAVKITL